VLEKLDQSHHVNRFVGFEAESLNVHLDFPLFQRMALPVTAGKTKIAGIKIHDARMVRLMEVLLHGGTQRNETRAADYGARTQLPSRAPAGPKHPHAVMPGTARPTAPRSL